MASDCSLSHAALIERADRAISEAVALRAEVRGGLEAAGRRVPRRPYAGDLRPSTIPPLGPMLPSSFLEPWWSIARTLAAAGAIMREADDELERAWHRILPTIETPSTLFEG